MATRSKRPTLSKNGEIVLFVVIAAAFATAALFITRDLFLRGHAISCDDGKRYTIDQREFTTHYSAYSVELEASIQNKGKVSAKFNPVQLQQLSESLQGANEFRKGVIAGYNGCAITKAQYAQYSTRFQTLDSLAREINQLAGRSSSSEQEKVKLDSLVNQYALMAGKLTSE
jgi:hypothetical protein